MNKTQIKEDREKISIDSIVTPEQLYAFFYGFDKRFAIRKIFRFLSLTRNTCNYYSLILSHLSVIQSFALLQKYKLQTNTFTHPTISIAFHSVFYIMCPFPFGIISIHTFCTILIPGQLLYYSHEQSCCHFSNGIRF